MKSALEEFTRQKSIYGMNEQQILDKFMEYAAYCKDPINIFNYMEQKSICIYLGNYWIKRSDLYAEMGDFKNSLLCLKEAISRDHIVNENDFDPDKHADSLKQKIIRAIKRRSSKGKRSAEEYTALYCQQGSVLENLQKLVQVCQINYPQVKKDLLKELDLKQHGKQNSWLAQVYAKKDEKMLLLNEKIKSLSNNDKYMSMRTPITKRDPMRLTKTVDSIQMAKKKKTTQSKRKLRIKKEMLSESNEDSEEEEMMHANTTPVGRHLTDLKRRVTFTMENIKIQKIRSQLEEEDKSHEILFNSKSLRKRGSILKKKQAMQPSEMDEEDQI